MTIIDATSCCDHHVNDAVEDLFLKAATDPPDPFEPHHSPFLQRLIELFTERGLTRIGSLQLELQKWIDGERFAGGERPVTPPGYVERWTPGEMGLAKLYLESLPTAEFTIDDWMMCIDYLHARYWPADQLRAEAEWLAVRSGIMGRVQSRMADLSLAGADALIAAAPVTVSAVVDRFGMTAAQGAMMRYGRVRATENVVTVADGLKRRVKATILEYQKGVSVGDPTIRESLQTRLFDAFSVANIDWRRLSMTEVAENQLQGLIASLKPGSRVRRMEQYKGACPFCRKIDGMEFDVVSPSAPDKDDWKQVWVGKTNVGRSAAPRKRMNGELIDRNDGEMWAPAAGVQHPHCRGTWMELKEPDSAGDAEFTNWMRSVLEKKE